MKKILLLTFLCICLTSYGQTLLSNTKGSFTFTPTGALSSKPIKVYYHIPDGDITKMPILMSFHGTNRNADDYRDYWSSMADTHKFMVFSPEFSKTFYPGSDSYNLANIFDDGDKPTDSTYNPRNEWTFSIIDPLFEKIKTTISGTQKTYSGWGHSAGSQFLHRFVMYMPDSKLDIAICSNAGWYTVPEISVKFPYGINKGKLPNSDIKKAFSKRLYVHLGLDDNNANSGNVRHNTIVDNQQGLHRLARGRYFYSKSKNVAQTMNTSFNWQKREVAGIGHRGRLMAQDAINILLQTTLSRKRELIKNKIELFPNPANNTIYFNNSKLNAEKAKLYNNNGELVTTFYFSKTSAKQKLDISKLAKGIYLLSIENCSTKIIKE